MLITGRSDDVKLILCISAGWLMPALKKMKHIKTPAVFIIPGFYRLSTLFKMLGIKKCALEKKLTREK
jgi:hypothetical protein